MKRQSKHTPKHRAPSKSSATTRNSDASKSGDLLALQLGLAQMYLNSFWNLMGLAICAVDKRFRIIERNDGFLGWAKSTLNKSPKVGTVLFDALTPHAAKTLKGLFKTALKGEHHLADIQLDLKKESKWIFVRVCPLFSPNGKVMGVLMTLRDISEQKRIEAENTYNRQLYLTLARHIPDSNMFLLDRDGRFLIAEGSEMRKAGVLPESLTGKLIDTVDANVFGGVARLLNRVFSGKTAEAEVEVGSTVYAIQLVPVRNESQKIYAAMGLMRNITEAKQIERRLTESLKEKERALRDLADANEVKSKLLAELRSQTEFLEKQTREDALTGLYNRRFLNMQLEQEFKRAKRYGNPLSVVMCDIDHFKKINDTFSHQIGDEVLKTLGRIFKAYSRSVDTVARFGGEEFVLVLPETPKQKAVVLCEKLRAAVEHYTWSEIHPHLSVTISFGISDNVRLGHYEKMLAEADEKLYEAKHSGRNCVAY
ncbi:MAG: sensor domain-containing diguanylate cyclase [Chloroherpetonaceae bacterium]